MRKRLTTISIWLLFFSAVLFYILLPPVWLLKKGPITITRWPKSGETTYSLHHKHPHWTPISNVSLHTLHAIIAAEDARFFEHKGLDFIEIKKSIELNFEQRRYVRGASTITQQVVKMAFLSPQKSLLRKIREATGAIVAEVILTKEQILEWYINLAEFGDGVFGIRQAADHYFQTAPELLTIQQSANLALVLPSPNSWSAGLKKKRLTDFGHLRFHRIITEMYRLNFITEELRETALATGNFGSPIKVPNEGKSELKVTDQP